MDVLDIIEEAFKGHPAKIKLVKYLFMHGLGVTEDGGIRCGKIKLPYNNVARALDVSPFTISQTVKRIIQNPKLRMIFLHLEPTFSLARDKKPLKYKVLAMSLGTNGSRRLLELLSKFSADEMDIVKVLIYPSFKRDLNIEVIFRGKN